ncbi:tRNA (N6-threonylcarbamoyladenosine(37)-N6)-methyltransferase TrmO [Paraglaciecola sp. 20A4]|uniref:tRNA (N6-threonylcarbamoyladenosine(37)-N6)-methyltransferase TrmO n=1 Tax=Paraglaciecola sp. 20A4 TaxID=2687288 RepID=UPI001409A302|nr:tRNA (N6-threonylcarbamoyladenosine(37)-N6)-methyltransferase TrmO [Paraglaciecola sp. 20A4]
MTKSSAMPKQHEINLHPLGVIHTPYQQKFAIPRQPNLVNAAYGEIVFDEGFDDPNMLRGIEQFSHLWLLFQFHKTVEQGWSPMVRPPRLGGNKKQGVLATRSTFRPNGIGMSVVKFDSVQHKNGRLSLLVKGVDLLDGTPIIDIKPYVPWADSIPSATGGFADKPPSTMAVYFETQCTNQLTHWQNHYPQLTALIEQVLAQDPRPAYKAKQDSDKEYGMNLFDLNIRWRVSEHANYVTSIVHTAEDKDC